MSKEKPDWEQLELIVAEIQRQLAPESKIKHNHRIIGKSGRTRKIDVSIQQTIGAYSMFIILDCKHHKKPVKLKDVASFAEQVEDVDAHLGVMVSSSGFDEGAKAVAKRKGIILQQYRTATETDWESLFGENAWITITKVEITKISALAKLSGISSLSEVPFDVLVYDEKGIVLGNLNDAFWVVWKQMGQPIGQVSGQVSFEGKPSYIKKENAYFELRSVDVSLKLEALKYLVNINFGKGDVLEEVETDKAIYKRIFSAGFDWEEVTKNQEGIPLSPEEYKNLLDESSIVADISGAKRYLRLVAEDKKF